MGVAEWKTARNPDALRTTLGSCVGIVLYNQEEKIGGLAHVLLAEPPAGQIANKGKYASLAVDALAADLKKVGGDIPYKARLFGGASMFDTFHSRFLQNIGDDNVKVSREVLAKLNIPVIMEDVGGTLGRSITVYMDDGRVLLRTNGKEKYVYKA